MFKPLSKEMRSCVEWMLVNGDEIHRHPGGFWAGVSRNQYEPAFGTSTIEALVSRKVAEYTEWQQGRSGRFPITAKLIRPASHSAESFLRQLTQPKVNA